MNVNILNKKLPKEFQQVEYIQSSGTQYINTNYCVSSEHIDIEFKCFFQSSTSGLSLFGSNSPYNLVPYSYGSRVFTHWVGSSSNLMSITYRESINNVKYTVNNGTLTCNLDGTITTASYTGSIISSVPIYIFGKNGNGTSMEKGSGYRLYSWKLYDNGILVRDYIPCYRKADNEIGLYDIVNDIFYTNAGTGTFTKGSDITEYLPKKISTYLLKRRVPAEYQPVEYLESTGMQYIDTGVSAPNGFRGIMNVSITTQVASYQFFAGAEAISDPWKRNFFGVNSSLQYHLGTYSNTISTMSATINTFYLLDVSTISGNRYYKSDGIDTMTVTDNTTPLTDRNLYIFAINSHGSVMYYSKIKIKQFLLYNENNTLVRNFIPVKRITDNKPGLYDTINDVFYTNANTSATQDFTVGNDIEPFIKQKVAVKLLCSEVPSEYQQVEYLESTGEQYIDTGFVATDKFEITFNFIPIVIDATQRYFGGMSIHPLSGVAFGMRNDSNFMFATNSTWSYDLPLATSTRTVIEYKNNGNVYLNGVLSTTVQPIITTTQNCIMFAVNYEGTIYYPASIKLYFCQIYNNGTIVRNFIPCYRKADNKPGLYDTVNGVFYTNANTSATQDFTVGSNKWIIK